MSVKNPARSPHAHSTLPRVGLVALLLLAVGLAVTQKHAVAGAQSTASATQTIQSMVLVGISTVHGTPIGSGAAANPEFAIEGDFGEGGVKGGASAQAAAAPAAASATARGHRRFNRPIPSKEAARRNLVANAATANTGATFPPPEPVVASDFVVPFQSLGFQGFSGINHIDSRTANNGNQFSVEPPDQGLCVGNGYIMEAVNDAVRVFDTQGNPLTGVEDMASFFGKPAAIDRTVTPPVFGPELSDPKCYFDQPTRRWFVSELMVDNGTNPGATGRSFNLLAVSQTDHPTGAFTIFMYDVTDDGLHGTPNHAGCPCFGDQPLLGADKYGVYQSTNEFGNNFNGAQIYAISKQQIEAAAASPTAPLPVVVHFDASQQLVPFGGLSYSIQPATAPTSDDWDHDSGSSSKNGVEYFLSALQFVDTFDNRIAVWAITNTKSLSKSSPTLTLSFAVLHSETYGQPNPATQKVGEIPLGVAAGNPEETINTNDDRMNQVVFVDGVLYGGVNSLLKVGGAEQQGIAWFGVKPRFDGPTLTGRVVSQGYVAVAGADVYFPSIGLNDDGNGVIAFSLSGAKYFPSAAYVDMVDGHDLPFVHISGAGKDPEDGFSGYPALGGDPNGVARWGDYSAAIADGHHVWFASEYIPKACSSLTPTTPLCRTLNANWGTFVSAVHPF